jgi:H+/Cl- antiporter ClcA
VKLAALILLGVAAGLALVFGFGTPLGAVVFQIDPPLLNTLQAGVQRRLSPDLWDQVILPLLQWPSWVVPGALGLLLLPFGFRRRA